MKPVKHKELNYKHKVVKEFNYGKRRCVVISIKWNLPKEIKSIPKVWHNGYVETKGYEQGVETNTEAITYRGNLDFSHNGKGLDASDGKMYIGFDTMHYYNFNNPKTQTAKYVERRCMMMVDELYGKDILFKIKGWFKNIGRYFDLRCLGKYFNWRNIKWK